MSASTRAASPAAILGVFFVLLGVGVILDADRVWAGGAVIVGGTACLLTTKPRGKVRAGSAP